VSEKTISSAFLNNSPRLARGGPREILHFVQDDDVSFPLVVVSLQGEARIFNQREV
jgi:hypothetical protein